MSGKFIKIVPPPHPCKPPKLNKKKNRETIYIGSVWECECGKIWRVSPEYMSSRLMWAIVV